MISPEAIKEKIKHIGAKLIAPESHGYLPNANRDTSALLERHLNQLRLIGYYNLLNASNLRSDQLEKGLPLFQDIIYSVIWLEQQPPIIRGVDYLRWNETLLSVYDHKSPDSVRASFLPV